MTPTFAREPWGAMPDGTEVERITLGDGAGFVARIITFGAAVQSLLVLDRDGRADDVVLGFDTAEGYLARRNMFGASVGRYANRIAGAAFTLDGVRHTLPANNGPNTLHGGPNGWDRHLWTVVDAGNDVSPAITLARTSPDGEEGFPGTVQAQLRFSVPDRSTLVMEWTATTDRPTVVNQTHHGFFNLGGPRQGGVLGHVLEIAADEYLPIDAASIPEDGPAPVAGTPFDFRRPTVISSRIRDGFGHNQQLRFARGYDHTWCLPGGHVAEPRLAARVFHPANGRVMEVLTDQPGIQFYSGNFLDGTTAGKGGRLHRQGDALCLEPHCWPDTPNRPDFPSARLDPGQTYRHRSVFRFSTH